MVSLTASSSPGVYPLSHQTTRSAARAPSGAKISAASTRARTRGIGSLPQSELANVDSRLQLALELLEEAPVGALGDDLLGIGSDHARFAQLKRVEADRVLRIVVAPPVVRDLVHRLQGEVQAWRDPPVHQLARGAFRL